MCLTDHAKKNGVSCFLGLTHETRDEGLVIMFQTMLG